MKPKLEVLKETAARLMLAALVAQFGTGTSYAVNGPIAIPTGIIDLTILAPITADITSAGLVKWRTGTANQLPTDVTPPQLTFPYISGPSLATPTRALCGDNTCNDQGDIWSDNAVKLDFRKPNNTGSAILIYTNNTNSGPLDPIGNTGLRGGLVGGAGVANDPARASVLPLLWKAVSGPDLAAVSTATIHVAARAIPANNPLFMYSELSATTGGACPIEGNNTTAVSRPSNGFCDFSTHYMVDRNNTDPNNMFFDKYPAGPKHNQTFDYSSLVGPFGVNTTEQGSGAGQFNPMYAVLGVNLTNAIQTKYATTIFVEVMQR